MTTNDVISTIENATNSLFQVLREQEANNTRLQGTIDRLEARVTWLESQLDSARKWGNEVQEQRDEARHALGVARDTMEDIKRVHTSDLDRLTNIIRSIGAAIDPIINPPYVPKEGEQPRDETGRFRPWADLTPVEQASTTRERHEASIELGQMLDEHYERNVDQSASVMENPVVEPYKEPELEYPRAVGDYHF